MSTYKDAIEFADTCQNKLEEVVKDLASVVLHEAGTEGNSVNTIGFSVGVQSTYGWLINTARQRGEGLEMIERIADYLGVEMPTPE